MAITVRRMQPADLERVLTLLAHWNIAPIAPSADIPNPERSEFIVENALVAEDGERIVGVRSFIRHSPTLGEGASLGVDPGYRGRGVALQLQIAGYRDMYARGIRTIRSEADRPEFIRMLTERFGYRVVGTSPKRHPFGSPEVDHWTILEVELDSLPEVADLRGKT
jgi:N-acetylglutamate synthase-like GNAT family acetyltransferase